MGSLWRRLRRLADGFTPSSCMTLHGSLFASVIFKPQPHVKWHSSRSSSMVRYPKAVESRGASSNIREGIWIAGTQYLKKKCVSGTTQTLEARHIKLFLCEGFWNGSRNYELIGSYTINKLVGAASGGIFDLIHIKNHAKAGK
uniref:Uncharacterized protein n=1 Tax=Salix viminalis TaxID=40686 RepID=A0A6N2NF94_SALVM